MWWWYWSLSCVVAVEVFYAVAGEPKMKYDHYPQQIMRRAIETGPMVVVFCQFVMYQGRLSMRTVQLLMLRFLRAPSVEKMLPSLVKILKRSHRNTFK